MQFHDYRPCEDPGTVLKNQSGALIPYHFAYKTTQIRCFICIFALTNHRKDSL